MENNVAYSTHKPTTSTTRFHFSSVDPSWQACLQHALHSVPAEYLEKLYTSSEWLPGAQNIFNAFSLPVSQVNYVLLGESPYPRAQSANGYAFWDAAVQSLWSETGLSKPVNRATSLRNIIKMLLIAEGALTPEQTTQTDIAQLDKRRFVQTNTELFTQFLRHGFLLLNASLVLQPSNVRQDAKAWRKFLSEVLHFIIAQRPDVELLLLGNIANEIDPLIAHEQVKKLYAEHPYNISFIHNPTVIDFFRPLHLLLRTLPPHL